MQAEQRKESHIRLPYFSLFLSSLCALCALCGKKSGVAESGYETRKNARLEPKMISGILIGNWNISK
ncbi:MULTISPECIES: hypothetical protein, partial [unclassified Microcoleus]|uniref:hypothetical protein n=1 Tax=unclassified Microcoleus TaxID=2642155 RepID=UPI0025CC8B22